MLCYEEKTGGDKRVSISVFVRILLLRPLVVILLAGLLLPLLLAFWAIILFSPFSIVSAFLAAVISLILIVIASLAIISSSATPSSASTLILPGLVATVSLLNPVGASFVVAIDFILQVERHLI